MTFSSSMGVILTHSQSRATTLHRELRAFGPQVSGKTGTHKNIFVFYLEVYFILMIWSLFLIFIFPCVDVL